MPVAGHKNHITTTAAGKPKKKAAGSVKTAAAKPIIPDLVVHIQTSNFLLRTTLISSIGSPSMLVWSWLVGFSRPSPSSPQGQPARWLSWRPLFSSRPIMTARPRRKERCKVLRLACRNADRLSSRKLELEHFLSQHGVDICLLSDKILNCGQAFRLANYVCYRRQTDSRGGTTMPIHRGIVHHSVPVPCLTHLEAIAVQVILAGWPAYFSPSRPLIGSDLTACFSGGLPVLTAGDLNAKHVDWNSRPTTRRGKLLRDNVDETSCLIFGLDTPTTITYNHSATPCLGQRDSEGPPVPGVSEFVLCTKLEPPHGTYRPPLFAHPFNTHQITLISGALTGPTSKLTSKIKFCWIRNSTTRWQSTHALKTSSVSYWRFRQHLLPNVARVTYHGLWYWPELRMTYARTTGGGSSGRSTGTPLWKPRSTACRSRWPTGSKSGGTTSGVRNLNPSIPMTSRCGGWPSGWWESLRRLPLVTPGESLSQTLRKPKPLATIWRLSFSQLTILRSW